jgi:hypothetical protein
LFADLHVHHARAADAGAGDDKARMRLDDLADEGRLAELEGAPADSDDPLLARARHVLRDRLDGVKELAHIVAQLEAAKCEDRADDAAALGERLLDLLYELEDEE